MGLVRLVIGVLGTPYLIIDKERTLLMARITGAGDSFIETIERLLNRRLKPQKTGHEREYRPRKIIQIFAVFFGKKAIKSK